MRQNGTKTRASVLLRDYRAERKLKQEELAEILGVTIQHISKLELGTSGPSVPLAIAIEDETGIPARAWTESPEHEEAARHQGSTERQRAI